MRIFIISLKGSKRRNSIQTQMENLNLSFEFFDAVNGKELTTEEITLLCDAQALNENPNWLNRGAVGCALSHLFVYQKIIDENIDKAIILEDDMLLNNDFLDAYNYLKKRKTEEEVIQIYYRAFKEVKFSAIDRDPINSRFSIVCPYSLNDIPITTGCYYITKDACIKLAKVISPIKVAADSWKYFILNSDFDNLKSIFPRPIEDAGFQSEIDYHESYSKNYVKVVKKLIDRLNNPLFNYLFKFLRKQREKKMSSFSYIHKESIIKSEKKHLRMPKK